MKSTRGNTEKRPVPQMQRASAAHLQTPVGMFLSNIFFSLDQAIFLPDSLQVLSEALQAYSFQQARKSSSKLEALPRVELGLLDSKSKVITTTPQRQSLWLVPGRHYRIAIFLWPISLYCIVQSIAPLI